MVDIGYNATIDDFVKEIEVAGKTKSNQEVCHLIIEMISDITRKN